jgi:hypothetical protein
MMLGDVNKHIHDLFIIDLKARWSRKPSMLRLIVARRGWPRDLLKVILHHLHGTLSRLVADQGWLKL